MASIANDYYNQFTLNQMTEKFKKLAREIYSSLDRETLIKIVVSFTNIKGGINTKQLINKYCRKRNVKGDECKYITDNLESADLLWDAHKDKFIELYKNDDTDSLVNKIILSTRISKDYMTLVNYYIYLENSVRVQKIELDAYYANSQELISEYDNINDEEKHILYETKDKFILQQQKYIFKYAKVRPDRENEILHELFIGLTVTNNFKGFAKIYSGKIAADCPPRIDSRWKCSYLVGEHIEGTVFRTWLKENNNLSNEIFYIFKSLVNNLYDIYEAADFTHYDLHPGNIIITDNFEPIIIDYGSAHAKVKGVDFGRILIDGNIYNKSMWQNDIFRLLFAMYITLAYYDNEWYLLNKCANYYKYVIPCGSNVDYENKLTFIFDNIKYFFPHLELQLDFGGEYDETYDFFVNNYEELYRITVDKHVSMIFNKLLFIFTKEIGCKFYDGTPDDKYTIISDPNQYLTNYNKYGAPVGNMLTMTYPFSKFKDLVNSIKL